MQRYQFEKICSQMEKEYGKIRKGQEDSHSETLFAMEGSALKTYRAHKSSNSLRFREAISLVLFDIKGRCDGREYDTAAFRNEDNARLEQALLMVFDPFTSPEVKEFLDPADLSAEQLREYYKEPVICLLRIKDSIDMWEKRGGSNGYFEFLDGYLGDAVREEM